MRPVSALLGRFGLGAAGRAAEVALWVKIAPAAVAVFLLVMVIAGAGGTYLASSSTCVPQAELEGTVKGIPAHAQKFVPFYLAAAKKYKLGARGPSILAGIHRVETDHGKLNGVTSTAGAIGHMQFMPATWEAYGVDANGDGKDDPYQPEDAIHSAANYLRASGAPGDWHAAIFAYNHAGWYVDEVLHFAELYGDVGDAVLAQTTSCAAKPAQGPAELQKSIRLYEPRSFKMLPKSVMAAGRAPQAVDERVWAASVWALKEYDMAVTAARETGHSSHGDGTSLDLIPANGTSIADWRRSTERFARDIGWDPGCGSSCSPGVIDAPAWVRWIGYNGDPAHGDPAHCSGSCAPHLHVSFQNDDGSEGALVDPDQWVMTFPAPGGPSK
jgi:hypothetical protein